MTTNKYQSRCNENASNNRFSSNIKAKSFPQITRRSNSTFAVALLIAFSQSISSFSFSPAPLIRPGSASSANRIPISRYYHKENDVSLQSGVATFFDVASQQFPIPDEQTHAIPPWRMHLDGSQADREILNFRSAMEISPSITSEEAIGVECAIRAASEGDHARISGVTEFCHSMLRTMDADALTLIAAAYHFSSCYRIYAQGEEDAARIIEEELMDHDAPHPNADSTVLPILKDALQLKKIEFDYGSIIKDPEVDSSPLRMMLLARSENWRGLAIRAAACLFRLRGILNNGDMVVGLNEMRVAREALHTYAPLASQLGMYRLKNEIENSAFRIAYSHQFEAVSSMMNQPGSKSRAKMYHGFDTNTNRENDPFITLKHDMDKVLSYAKDKVTNLLQDNESFSNFIDNITVTARVKEPFSLWKKMRKLGAKSVLDVPDALALRIIVDPIRMNQAEDASKVEDINQSLPSIVCYIAQKICTDNFAPLKDGRFKDYITKPKSNGYQSLHYTACIDYENEQWPMEIQIRSREMDQVAEFGLASHWHYKFQNNNNAQNDDRNGELNSIIDHSTAAYLNACVEWQWQHAQNNANTWAGTSNMSPNNIISRGEKNYHKLEERVTPFIEALKVTQSKLTSERVFIFLASQKIGENLRNGKLLELPSGACVLDALRESKQTLGFATKLRDQSCLEEILHNNNALTSVTQKLRTGDVLTIPVHPQSFCP